MNKLKVISFDIGLKNLAYVKMVIDVNNDNKIKVIDAKLVDLCNSKKVKGQNQQDIIQRLFLVLEKIEVDDDETILIENQFGYTPCKSIAIAIYMY